MPQTGRFRPVWGMRMSASTFFERRGNRGGPLRRQRTMFRGLIPFTLVALVTTGAFAANAAGAHPTSASGPCPPTDVGDTSPPTTDEDHDANDDLDSRCDVDPEAYYLNY